MELIRTFERSYSVNDVVPPTAAMVGVDETPLRR